MKNVDANPTGAIKWIDKGYDWGHICLQPFLEKDVAWRVQFLRCIIFQSASENQKDNLCASLLYIQNNIPGCYRLLTVCQKGVIFEDCESILFCITELRQMYNRNSRTETELNTLCNLITHCEMVNCETLRHPSSLELPHPLVNNEVNHIIINK